MDDKRKALYDALSGEYNLGSYEEFTEKLNDENKRKALYDAAGQDYNLGTYEEYSTKLGFEPNAIKGDNAAVDGSVPMFDDEPNAPLAEPDAERGFGAGAREGWKGLKAGFQNLWGETANVFTGSSQDSINALNELNEMVRQGKDVAVETEDAWTDAGREIRTGAMEFLPGWMIKGWKERTLAKAEKNKVLDDIREALGEAGGDVDKARAILEQRAQEMSYGDEQIAEAAEKFADVKPTEGFGAWVGSNVVQMIPSASALIVGAVTKSPAAAKAIGMIGMGGMTAATAGTSMYEARQAGATDAKTWKVGITDGMIEYLTEKLPFDRYTSRIMGKVKGEVAQDLFSALRTNKATRTELEKLLVKANERLGGRLFSKKNLKDYVADMLAEGASEFSAEALQTMTSMMYENPEDYPTINEILTNGWEGAKAGFFMGAVLGGASKTMEHTQNRKRRMDKGSVDVALVDFGNGEKDVAEVVEYDASSNTAVVLHDGSFEKVSGDAIADGYRFSYEEFENARLRQMEDEAVVSGNVTEGQIQGLEDNIARDIDEIKALAPEMTESEISAVLQSEMAVDPDTPLGEAVAKYQEDVARHGELVAAKREADAAKKEAIRTEIETAVGQRFWVQESGEDDGSGIVPVSETVEEVVYADGTVGYVVGMHEKGYLAMVFTDGTKGFTTREEITEKENSGEILSNTVMGLDDYLAVKMDIDEVTREKARMQEEHALSVEEMIATHPQGSVINVGTEEAKIEVPVIAPPTKDGVIVQMPDGTTPMLTWEDVAHAEKKEITPKTNAQLNQSIVDEYRVAYTPAAPAASQPTQQKEEQVKRTSPANPLPLKADGSVDQTALWNKDPEGWAQWNDEKRQDGGADSLAYVTNAIAIEQAKMAELQAARSQETDFDRRDALDAEIATAQERIDRLVAIQQGYLAQPAVADAVQNVQPEPEPQTEEERAAVEEQRREPLRKRAKELGEKLGVKINIAESLADVQEEQAREAIMRAEVTESKDRYPGWYNRDTGEVTIYLPHVASVTEVDKTLIHEIVAHKGLRGLLGKEGYNVLCDAVWDMMTEAERAKYMAYPGVNGDKRLAADEYIARFAEGLDLEQSRPIWNKIAEAVQKILNSMGIRLEVTKEDLADLIAASYMRLQEQARAAQTENAPIVEEVTEEIVPEATIEQQMPESIEKPADPNGVSQEQLEEINKATGGEIETGKGKGSPVSFSVVALGEGAGLEILKDDGKGNVAFVLPDGRVFNAQNPIKPEDLKTLPDTVLGYMMKDAKSLGVVDPAKERMLWNKYTLMLNAILSKGSAENGGYEYLSSQWQWIGDTIYKTVAINSDSQYSFSLDITRVCKKNEAVINAIAEMQARLGYGITPGQIMDIYLTTSEEGYQVPCPVCYVFSRYIRNGKYATIMINGQRKYGSKLVDPKTLTPAQQKKMVQYWLNELDKIKAENKANSKEIAKANSDITTLLDEIDKLSKQLTDPSLNLTEEQKNEMIAKIYELDARYKAALNVVSQASLDSWITQFAIHKAKVNGKEQWVLFEDSYMGFPEEMALDLRQTATVMRKYPAIQRFRNSRGAAAGKEITFVANNDLGDVPLALGSAGSTKDLAKPREMSEEEWKAIKDQEFAELKLGVKNLYQQAVQEKDPAKKKKILEAAKRRFTAASIYAKQQSLRGGQRMWSWSDNIERLAPDVFVNLLQLEMLGGALQSYSKQLEGIKLVASMNGYVNGSLMGKGNGYREVSREDAEEIDGQLFLKDGDFIVAEPGKKPFVLKTPVYQHTDGKFYVLEFDDVVGIDPFGKEVDGKHMKGLFELNAEYDRAGNIIVGMNDLHIRMCMADDRIFFIIPWHSSGANTHILAQMYEYLGVEYDAALSQDYTNVQSEKRYKAPTETEEETDEVDTEETTEEEEGKKPESNKISQFLVDFWNDHYENAREFPGYGKVAGKDFACGIEGGVEPSDGNGNLSASQMHYRELRDAIFVGVKVPNGVDKNGKAKTKNIPVEEYSEEWLNEIMNDEFLSQVYSKVRAMMGNKGMTNADTKAIYPYEYWDENSTYDTADINGARYLEYCRRLGYKPKFCGKLDGKPETDFGNFTDDKGYWKVLIDRRMYGLSGRFQDLTPVTAENFTPDLVDPEVTKEEFVVTRVADEAGTQTIVDKAIAREESRPGGIARVDYDMTLSDALDVYAGRKPAPKKSGVIDLVEEAKKAAKKDGVSFSVIGETGAMRDKTAEGLARMDNLEVARKMEAELNPDWSTKENENALKIKVATGWERGADGKWRYEVDDFMIKNENEWMDSKKKLTLRDIVEPHPVFDMYPDLLDINVVKDRSKYNLGAYYDHKKNEMKLPFGALKDDASFARDFGYTPRENKSFMRTLQKMVMDILHEVQHAIQDREGFAPGGSSDMLMPEDRERYASLAKEYNALAEEYNAILDKEGYSKAAKEKLVQTERKEAEMKRFRQDHRIGGEGYKRLAGEVEAYNVETRHGLSDYERYNSLLASTEDVARKDQIFLMDAVAGGAQNNISFRVTRTDEQREKLFQDAKNEFGTTKSFDEAGYMLPDGTLLDFSEEDFPGERSIDHRAIEGAIIANGTRYENRWEYLADFMNEGAIRLMPESASINLIKAPTKEQRDRLFDFIYKYNGEVILEVTDDRLNSVVYMEYNRRTSPSRIFRDIDRYFNEGIVPQQSGISFRAVNDNQAIFVSNAAKAVEGIKQEKATPEQWLKMIEKNGGLKAGEDKWMGLSDWLKASDKKTLTKQEVLDFVNENMIVIEEQHYGIINEEEASMRQMREAASVLVEGRTLGELQAFVDDEAESASRYDAEAESDDFYLDAWLTDRMVEEFGDDFPLYYTISGGYVEYIEPEWWDRDEDSEVVEDENDVRPIHSGREQYTTKGLNNLHEIALTVPTIKKWTGGAQNNLHFEDAGDGRAIAWIRFGETIIESKEANEETYQETIDSLYAYWDYLREKYGDGWKQAMTEKEKAEEQRLANTYRAANKKQYSKILVIDEIQSKRHQEGREQGYMTKEERAEFDAHLDNLKRTQDALLAHIEKLVEKYPNTDYHIEDVFKNFGAFSAEDKAELTRLKAEYDAEYAKGTEMVERQSKLIPDAPFDKNWPELAMKRMLRYAAENGYDVVAWTKGDQQAERYSMAKSVKRIESGDAEGFAKTVKIVDIYPRRSNDVLTLHVDANGKILSERFAGDDLSDVVGKELARKLMAKGEVVLEGDDLKAGEGMKGFYDKMLPAFMNKYGKKWGVKVEDIDLPNLEEAGRVMHSVPVTEEMKASVMGGQVMFRMRTEEEDAMEFAQSAIDDCLSRYNDVAEVKVFPVNEETAERFGYTLEELKKTGGEYVEDEDLIAIFANEDYDDSAIFENIFFHESIHKIASFFTEFVEIGEWLWSNAGEVGLQAVKTHIEENYKPSQYNEEMLTFGMSLAMSIGVAGKQEKAIPQIYRSAYRKILNEIGYEPEKESRRAEERISDSSRKEAHRNERKADEGGRGKEGETRTAELSAEERRVIGEYFPEFNKSEDVRMKVNSQGKDLTEGQKEFFANSKAVDKDGNLLVLYHGTPRAGFTEFKSGWFTTSKEDAISYSGDRKGRLFNPNEKYEPETLVAGDFRLGHMTFDSEEDRAAFLAKYPSAESAMSRIDFDLMTMQAEDEEYDALIERKPELQKIWNAYREYERERFVDTTIDELLDNPDAYTEDDFRRAILAYDSNAIFDEIDEIEDSAERKDALVEALEYMKNDAAENGGFIGDMKVATRIPRNGEGVSHNDSNARTYEAYINIEHPLELDAAGRHSEFESGDIYKAVEEALSDEQYDGVIIRNWRVGRYQQLGDVVVPKDGNQIKLTSNENPTKSHNVSFRTSLELDEEFGDAWRNQQNEDGRHSTQVANTKSTYEKIGRYLEDAGMKGASILDASSGLGLGTQALREMGFNVDDVEPFPSENREAPTFSSYADIDKQYDVVISNAVLNVIPDDWRADVLHQMADAVKEGGKMIINTRPASNIAQQGVEGKTRITLDSPSEILVKRGDRIAAYQKGFTSEELAEWIKSELGEGWRVEKATKKNSGISGEGTAVVIKEGDNASFRVTGTPTDEVVANGLTLTPAQTAEVAANIFAALPEESRKKITEGLNGNILGLKDAILQIPASLAIKENWNEEDRAMADVVAEEMTKMAGEMTRPFSAPEALWLLYNNLNKGNDLISQASRALVQRNLGFDEETLERQEEAKQGVSFRMVGDATANAKASMYNRGAVNVWTRLKESFVDMQASVEELVSAIEKATGKVAKGFENILLALNQQSSKGLAAMESYEQRFLMPMFDEVRKIMDNAYAGYDTVVRYVILKHGLERNKKLAQRDAKAHYQEIYDEMIAKVNSMDDRQKRTYLTNAQLQDADAKAKLATLKAADTSAFTEEEKNAHKRELAKAKEEAKKAKENLERAQKINSMSEQELKDELDKVFEKIENGTDSVYKELRKNDYSGISSMFYDQLGVNRKDYSTEEEYQAALMLAKNDRFSSLEEVEEQAEGEVESFEGRVDTKELWKRINAATKETLRQQYEANMISKDQYESLRNMFEYYVPLRGFKDNTAEDMYTYYRKPNSTGYTKPILGAEGRKTEAESPFGWIAAMAGSAIASNVKNEAKLALYYFVSNRPNNGIATLSRTWFVHTPGDVDANGKKIFKPAYPPFSEDLSSDAAKQAYEDWQEQMRELQKQGLAYEAGQRLNLGNAVVNISDANKPEHVVTVKVAGKDYTIVINGNPRAAQAINGELNLEGTADDYSAIFGPVLRWMSSVNTSYNPEFWITNLMRDMAFTWMAVNTKEDPAYRKKFSKNYWKCFRVIGLVVKNEKGTIGNSYMEDMYKDFVKYGGVTGYTQIKDSETWEKEIDNYLRSTSPESLRNGKMMRGMKTFFHAAHRFGESLEQVSRFAAFLTSREMGKTINEAIADAKEITVNFNRKGSGKMISLEESKYLTDKNGQPLSLPARWAAVGLSSIAPLGRRTIMFFNAAVQGLNSVYRLWKKNPRRLAGWTAAYFAIGVLNAAIHALLDDDDDYLDIPQYERRNSLMLGGNGAYLKWALPQEARAFYALGDLAVETVLGRNPHQNVVGEAMKIATEVLPVNPSEGWKAFVPSVAIPAVELMLNEDYKGAPIYNEQKWLSDEERKRTAKWSSAYQGTGAMYKGIAQGLNYVTGGDKHDAGKINLQPEKMEYIVQSAFGGTIRTADKFINTIWAMFDPEEDVTVRQTPFLNRILTLNDERFKNVHVNEVFDYYKADADHALTLEKRYTKDRDLESLNELRKSEEYQWARVYGRYKKALDNLKEKLKVAEGTAEKKELMRQQDELKRRVIKEISEL